MKIENVASSAPALSVSGSRKALELADSGYMLQMGSYSYHLADTRCGIYYMTRLFRKKWMLRSVPTCNILSGWETMAFILEISMQEAHMFCKVSFSDWPQTYTYLGDDESYQEGDRVIVPAGKENRDTIVTTEEIEYLPERLAPFPLDKMKHIKGSKTLTW